MRDIKFRCKTIDGNEWIFGFYVRLEENKNNFATHYILTGKSNLFYGSGTCRETFDKQEVIPESVGEFAGFFDDENTDIFEGDILYCRNTAFNYFVCLHNSSFVLVPILAQGVHGERIILTQKKIAYKKVRGNTFDKNIFAL